MFYNVEAKLKSSTVKRSPDEICGKEERIDSFRQNPPEEDNIDLFRYEKRGVFRRLCGEAETEHKKEVRREHW